VKTLKDRVLQAPKLKELLSKSVGGMEDARSVDELHASDLTRSDPEFCPREVVLMRLLGVTRKAQYVQESMRVTWDEGRDKQWRVNNVYLREYMVGGWKCVRCDERVEWGRDPEMTGKGSPECHDGKAHRWEYVEPEFRHPSGFTGSIDGIVQFNSSKLRPLEIKIIKGESAIKSSAPDFRSLVAPLAEHRVRTQLYLRLIAESPDERTSTIDTSQAHVLYVMRGHGLKGEDGRISPFKDYVVKRDDPAVERYVRMAYAVSGDMPSGVCSSALCPRATKCPVVKECFSGKHPPKNYWSDGL
jgi:hypothetical protein